MQCVTSVTLKNDDSLNPAYPATEQLVLGNRLLKIASWIHVQAYDKTAKANVWMQMA